MKVNTKEILNVAEMEQVSGGFNNAIWGSIFSIVGSVATSFMTSLATFMSSRGRG